MKTFFLSLFFFLGGSLIFAQNVLLKGSVGDGKSPLPEATLSVEGQEVHATSDEAGNFQFSLPKGFYILDIHAKGYRSQRMDIELTNNLTLPTITLQKELMAQGEHTVGNTINLSDEELDDEEGSPEMISGFLQSSQDLYFRRSSFDFSPVFYRPRGYQSNAATVLVNGATGED